MLELGASHQQLQLKLALDQSLTSPRQLEGEKDYLPSPHTSRGCRPHQTSRSRRHNPRHKRLMQERQSGKRSGDHLGQLSRKTTSTRLWLASNPRSWLKIRQQRTLETCLPLRFPFQRAKSNRAVQAIRLIQHRRHLSGQPGGSSLKRPGNHHFLSDIFPYLYLVTLARLQHLCLLNRHLHGRPT